MRHIYLVVLNWPVDMGGLTVHGAYETKNKANRIIEYHRARDSYSWQYAEVMKFLVRK